MASGQQRTRRLCQHIRHGPVDWQPERVQALIGISRSALYAFAVYYNNNIIIIIRNLITRTCSQALIMNRVCCHSNESRSVGMRQGKDRQTHRRPWPISISPRLCLTRNVIIITFRVSRRRREMYCVHARLCVCLCVCPRPHAHTIARTRM